jgi:phage-related protein
MRNLSPTYRETGSFGVEKLEAIHEGCRPTITKKTECGAAATSRMRNAGARWKPIFTSSCKYLHVYSSIDMVRFATSGLKPLMFLGSSRDDLRAMPDSVRHDIGLELMRVQFGELPADFKPMAAVGAGAFEIRVHDESGAYRAICVARFENAIYVLHAFQKKSRKTAKKDIDLAKVRYKMIGSKS